MIEKGEFSTDSEFWFWAIEAKGKRVIVEISGKGQSRTREQVPGKVLCNETDYEVIYFLNIETIKGG